MLPESNLLIIPFLIPLFLTFELNIAKSLESAETFSEKLFKLNRQRQT